MGKLKKSLTAVGSLGITGECVFLYRKPRVCKKNKTKSRRKKRGGYKIDSYY